MSVATVSQNAVVDLYNGSTTPLGAAETFTGRAEDVSIYAAVNVFVFTDQAGTLFVEFSTDQVNWDKSFSFAVSASTANTQSVAPCAQYVRVRYLNGATPQTSLRLQTFYQPVAPAAASTMMGTVTANQGTAAALAGYWPVRVTDGVNTMPTQDAVTRAAFQKITDGTNVASVTGANALVVDGSAVTQPVSAVSLPLPTGAATATNQTTLGNQTTKINDGTNTAAVTGANALKIDGSAVTQPVSGTVTANVGTTGGLALDATLTGGTQTTRITDGTDTVDVTAANALKVDGSAVTQPVSATALPLPTGAATAANQTTLGAQTTKINDGTNTAAVSAANALKVDGSAVTQPVSGTVTSNIGTTGGLALDATLTGGTQTTRITDGTDTADVTAANALKVDGSAVTQPVSAASLPLPTGAATSANQTTLGNQTTKLNDGTNTAAVTGANALKVDGSAVTQPISAATPLPVNVVGTHANAWSAAAVGAGGSSASIDCQYTPHISAFGNSTGATTISLQVSQDNTNFYTAATVAVGGGGGDFALNVTIGARYIRLQSSQARTITATITGKD